MSKTEGKAILIDLGALEGMREKIKRLESQLKIALERVKFGSDMENSGEYGYCGFYEALKKIEELENTRKIRKKSDRETSIPREEITKAVKKIEELEG